MRKTIVLIGAFLIAAVMFAAPVSAQYGPNPSPGVSTASPTPGGTLGLTGNNCTSPVTITLDGEVVGTTEANADGTFAIDINVPDAPGDYLLAISCTALDSGLAAGAAASGEFAAGVELAGGAAPCGLLPGENSANTSCILTVVAEGTVTAAGTLPRTGSDSSLPLAQIGVVLVAFGGLAVLVTRKRNATIA